MKRLFMALACFFIVIATLFTSVGCGDLEEEKGSGSGETDVYLTVEGGQRRFFMGSAFSCDGLTVYKQEEGKEPILLEEGMYAVDDSAFNGKEAGRYTIAVRAEERALSTTYDVEVLEMPIQKDSLKVLMIGNSFSDDTIEYAWHIANDLGITDVTLGNLFIAGCDLNKHWTNVYREIADYEFRIWKNGEWQNRFNVQMVQGIEYADWDFITLQQSSGLSGVQSSYKYLENVLQYVREMATNKQVKVLWNMTWAYQQNSTHEDFRRYGNDQATMYQSIVDCVNAKVAADIDGVIACGTAVQNGRLSVYGDTWTRDGFHLSLTKGRYLAGVTLVGTLTGRDISALQYMPSGVTEEEREVIKRCAIHAIDQPFQPTQP